MDSEPSPNSRRAVFFFDIDNCLYPRSKNIHHAMATLIDQYFQTHLSLSPSESARLHQTYYTQYGLAIEGLVRHHKVDPLSYNELVDDALPLDSILGPDPALRELLQSFDPRRVKLWLFTNAYKTHGARVTQLLGVADCFEGMTYCDYAAASAQIAAQERRGQTDGAVLLCKPHPEMFDKAEKEAGVQEGDEIYFIDDSALNCRAARDRGWRVVQKVEPEDEIAEEGKRPARWTVRQHEELRELFPALFKGREDGGKADGGLGRSGKI